MPDRVRADLGVIARGFAPAIDYFRQKINLPTATWRDLQHGMHARAFVVAGAMKEDLVRDLRTAVDAAIADGESYDQFKARFKDIVKRHGWQHTGSAGWRSRVIYHTNTRTAYAAGRYAQMTEPATLAHMPYWLYDHTTIVNPREEHQAWDNRVWLASDPIWKVIYPPNGWGCNCRVRPLSRRQLEKMGKTGPDPTPENVEAEIPPEWRYNVGEAAYGMPPAPSPTPIRGSPWKLMGAPPATPTVEIDATAAAGLEAPGTWEGGRRIVNRQFENGFRYDLALDAQQLQGLLDPHVRGSVLDAVQSPDEVYLGFYKNIATGQVALRMRIIRALQGRAGDLLLVMDAQGGQLVAIEALLLSEAALQSARQGTLVQTGPR